MRKTKAFAIPATIIVVLLIMFASAILTSSLQVLIPSLYWVFKICNIAFGGYVGWNISRIYRWVKNG